MNDDSPLHDAHLRQALRHAPDAQLQPPAAVREFILDAARTQARHPRPAALDAPRWALRLWDWLARPAVATGLAGVMAATLVGLMWWDQPLDEALPRSPSTVVLPAPASPPASPPTSPPTPAPAPTAAPTATPARSAAPPPATTAPAAQDKARHDKATRVHEEAAARGPADASVTASPAMRPPAVAAAPAPAPTEGAAEPASNHADRLRSLAAAEPPSRRDMARPEFAEARAQREAAAFVRVSAVRAAIAAEPSRWAWQHDAEGAQPMSDTVTGWLARLDADAGDRWQPVDTAVPPTGRELRLLHDGRVQHVFRFTEGGVLWQRSRAGWQQVALPPAILRALEASAP